MRLGITQSNGTLPDHHLKVFCTAVFSSVLSSNSPFTYKPTNPSFQQSRYTTVARPAPPIVAASSPWLAELAYAFQPPEQSRLFPTLPLKPVMVQPSGAVESVAVPQSTSGAPHPARQQQPNVRRKYQHDLFFQRPRHINCHVIIRNPSHMHADFMSYAQT